MNINKVIMSFGMGSLALLGGTLLHSCAADEPFSGKADGVLQMKLVLNSDLTRGEDDAPDLAANCVVYISSEKGLLHKYKGLENLPDQLALKGGHYVAEAWTGDSVSASFDKKFFRGYQPFDINGGVSQVVVNCGIANVVASVNESTIEASLLRDYTISIANSKASLDFTSENVSYAKGYYMMPNGETSLEVTISGKNADGRAFTKKQTIADVKRAHEYVLNFTYNPEESSEGGAFITITIDDNEILVENEEVLLGRPYIKGLGFDISHQLVGEPSAFQPQYVKINAFGGLSHLVLSSPDHQAMNLPHNAIDLKEATEVELQALSQAGITTDQTVDSETNLVETFLNFSAAWLNSLPERDTEYVLEISATDAHGKTSDAKLRIAVGQGAVVMDDPIVVNNIDHSNLLNVLSRSAKVSGSVDASAVNPGVEYRIAGSSSAWQKVPVGVASGPFTIGITGLQPSTRYEYRAVADGFESSDLKYLTTEGTYTIPGASFEEWGTYSASTMLGTKTVVFPGLDRNNYYWDSGNEGAATASKQVLFQSSDMVHSGSSSAKLASSSAVGVIAAGNVFTGVYVKTDGTDGVLSLGREFDGSHPSKVRVYANYRPGSDVKVKSGNEKYVEVTAGGKDHGQVYVALTTAPITIRTKASERKLFPAGPTNEDGLASQDYDKVVAYGQVTWKDAFGPDGGLQMLEIPFEYHDIAKTQKPLYLVIVASASKFGDFYAGSASSVMYLDDFELIYE